MKDATGELSMTAVAVVAIGAIGVVFTTVLWPQIKQTILRSSYCSQALYCDTSANTSNVKQCWYCDNSSSNAGVCDDDDIKPITCPNT